MFDAIDDNWQYLKDALRLQNKHLTSFLNQVAEISSKRWCCLFSNIKRTRWRAFSEAEHSTHHFLVNYSALLCWHSQQERLDALALPSIGIIFMAKFCQLQSSSFFHENKLRCWERFCVITLLLRNATKLTLVNAQKLSVRKENPHYDSKLFRSEGVFQVLHIHCRYLS